MTNGTLRHEVKKMIQGYDYLVDPVKLTLLHVQRNLYFVGDDTLIRANLKVNRSIKGISTDANWAKELYAWIQDTIPRTRGLTWVPNEGPVFYFVNSGNQFILDFISEEEFSWFLLKWIH